jgi:hypothetical protein
MIRASSFTILLSKVKKKCQTNSTSKNKLVGFENVVISVASVPLPTNVKVLLKLARLNES